MPCVTVRPVARSLLFALLLGALPASAATITVTTLADELNANGNCSLREAVQAANTNAAVDACVAGSPGADAIVIPAGTIPVAATIQVDESVTIRGAGRASSTVNRGGNTAFNSSAPTVLMTLEDVSVVGGVNALDGAIAATRVDFSGGNTVNTRGGAITLADVTFSGGSDVNTLSGAIAMTNATMTDLAGTGVNTSSAPITMTDVSMTGGGVNSSSGALTLTRVRIVNASNNAVSTSSGAIALTQSAIVGGQQGGVSSGSGAITLTESSVVNTADNAVNSGGGAVSLMQSVVSGSAETGIDVSGSAVTLVNSTVSGNQNRGINGSGTLTLNAVTITGNAAGGIRGSIAATTTAVHAILGPNGAFNCQAPLASSTHSIDSGNTCGLAGTGDRTNANPLLGPLADNGGRTLTHLPQAGSPAIDAGSNALCQAVDQRGVARPIDGDGNGTATCDVGAAEAGLGAPPPPPPAAGQPIPTLSEWALMALVVVLGVLAAGRVRRETSR